MAVLLHVCMFNDCDHFLAVCAQDARTVRFMRERVRRAGVLRPMRYPAPTCHELGAQERVLKLRSNAQQARRRRMDALHRTRRAALRRRQKKTEGACAVRIASALLCVCCVEVTYIYLHGCFFAQTPVVAVPSGVAPAADLPLAGGDGAGDTGAAGGGGGGAVREVCVHPWCMHAVYVCMCVSLMVQATETAPRERQPWPRRLAAKIRRGWDMFCARVRKFFQNPVRGETRVVCGRVCGVHAHAADCVHAWRAGRCVP